MPSSVSAEWRDIKVDLTNGKLLEESEKVQWGAIGEFGIAVDEGGNVSRVAKDADNAVCVISGKWHSNTCWASLNITVPVEGNVKISYGNQSWGSNDVIVKNGDVVVTTFKNVGTLWDSTHPDRISSGYYSGGATTLTISGGTYPTYFAIEKVDYIPNYKTATFSIGETGATGVVPASITKDINFETTFTIPSNFTLYKEGYTLTGWNDGVKTYNVGETYTMSENVTFTPVFTANTVSLDDRTEAVTVKWNFGKKAGVPEFEFNNSTGIWVTQANVAGESIDVKMDVDATAKLGTYYAILRNKDRADNDEWAQMVEGIKMTVPSVYGATVELKAYGAMSSTKIDNSTDYTSGTTISKAVTSTNSTIDVVGMDGSYYSYLSVTYPVIVISPAKEFTTFCSTSPLNFTAVDGLEAYVVTGSTNTTITLAKVTDVPASTGLILKKTGSAASYNVPVGTATSLAETNKLVGVTEATAFTAGDYLLSDGKFVRGTAGTLAAGKAYLPAASVSAGAREMLLDFGGTTGIHQIESAKQRVEGYYNLAGQRVAQPRKGLYIVNGKKVVIK